MKTIAFAIQKGGTGKTSISVSIAIELASMGNKVLLVDADPQGNATTWVYSNGINKELADVLKDNCNIEKAIEKTSVENLFIIPTAGIDGELKEFSDNAAGGKLSKFKNVLKQVADNFDFCIIDTSPNFGNFEQSIFYATNEIITVLQLDEFSKDGLQIFINRLKTFLNDLDSDIQKPYFNKIIFNAKNDSFAQHNQLLEKYKALEKGGYRIYSVPQDQAFKHAQTTHKTVQEVTSKEETKKALNLIANEINGDK